MYLKRLDESPQQRSDSLASIQQLDQSHYAEQPEKIYVDQGSRTLLFAQFNTNIITI
jgi:hypothetical protein